MPTGTVTFLFTDIEGSTRLLERLRARYAEVLADQRKLLRAAFANWRGREIDTQGDSFFVAFPSAADALRAAVEAQYALAAWRWPDGVEVRVRMGIHTGEPLVATTGYVGMDVHRAARVAAAGHGGQILVSGTTRDLVADDLPPKVALRDLGTHKLKDLRGETHLYQVVADGLLADFPAPVTATADEPAPTPGDPPYRGLQAFEEQDASLFFGREETVARLVELVHGRRFVALIGASGSGKSSILRAGLVHALRAARPAWRILLLTPTAHPLEALAAALAPDTSARQLAALIDDLRGDPRSLTLALRPRDGDPPKDQRSRARATRSGGSPLRTLVAIDQLEEVFTLCRDEEERGAFLANLMQACGLAEGPATAPPDPDRASVVITLRADFYAFLAPYPPLREASAASQLYVGAMSSDEQRQAIEEPARRGDWQFVPGLVDLLLRDVGAEPGALPLLSHALLETWRRRRGTTMTLRSYAESGGVKGAIARTADRVYEGELTAEQRPAARNIFVRLTELGEGTQDTRRRARLAELLPADPAQAAPMRALIGALADARLVTVAEDDVEVAHEALIREWPTLREWLRADREGLRLHRRLTEAAGEWELASLDDGLLYRGARLAQARDYVAANPDALNDLERRFLEASIARANREEAEREAQRRRELDAARALAGSLRQRAFLLAGGLLVAAVLAAISVVLARQSDQNAALAAQRAAEASANAAQASDNAGLAEQRAKQAQANLAIAVSQRLGTQADVAIRSGKSGELGALLALNGLHAAYTPESDAVLQRAAHLYYGERVLRPIGSVYSAAITPDGRVLITESGSVITIWDLATGSSGEVLSDSDPTRFPAGTPGGVILSRDGTVLFGSLGTAYRLDPKPQNVTICGLNDLIETPGGVAARTLSPDGKTVATALVRGGIVLDPIDSCDVPRRRIDGRVSSKNGAPDNLRGLAFSPDGKRLAAITGSSITIWDVAAAKIALTVDAGTADLRTIVFSPDGRQIVSAAADGRARLFDARTGSLVRTFGAEDVFLNDAEFSPDGRRIATARDDGIARIWDVASGRELQRYAGHSFGATSVVFSPDGRSLFTTSWDGTVRQWSTDAPAEPGIWFAGGTAVNGLAFSADANFLAVGTEDRLQVRDLRAGSTLLDVAGTGVDRVALSADGRALIAASGSGASLWDVASARLRLPFGPPGAGGRVGTAAYDGQEDLVLATSGDGGLALWDPATGAKLRSFAAVGGMGAISGDGSTVVYEGPLCGRLFVVDARTGAFRSPIDLGSCTLDLALNRDGTRLVSADYDHRPRLWDLTSGKLIREFAHPGFVSRAIFSADSRMVLTAGSDARLWETETADLVRVFPSHANTAVTAVALSPDGKWVVIGGPDGSFSVTPVQIDQLVADVCSRVLRDLTAAERTEYSIEQGAVACP